MICQLVVIQILAYISHNTYIWKEDVQTWAHINHFGICEYAANTKCCICVLYYFLVLEDRFIRKRELPQEIYIAYLHTIWIFAYNILTYSIGPFTPITYHIYIHMHNSKAFIHTSAYECNAIKKGSTSLHTYINNVYPIFIQT